VLSKELLREDWDSAGVRVPILRADVVGRKGNLLKPAV